MRIIYTFTIFCLACTLLTGQNIRFSYTVTNPTPDVSKLTVYVQKIGGGTENVAAFNWGFYYQPAEATVEGYAMNATDASMNATELGMCVDATPAEALGWSPDLTGAIIAVTAPPGLPSGYTRLFTGQITDGNFEGSNIGATPTAIVALLLDNTIGSGSPSQDSAYQGASDTNPAWEYSDNTAENAFPIVVTGTRQQALPIVLVAFNAIKFEETSSLLEWTTVSEVNSSHFTIQRSFDKVTWTEIGDVAAAGNSQMIENYSFIDKDVYNNKAERLVPYYRLAMYDRDGSFKYSPIQSVIFSTTGYTGRDLIVYPNPSSDGIQVEWDANEVQPTSIEFYDVVGRLVHSVKVSNQANQQYIDFRPTIINDGMYMMRIMHHDEAIEHKQIVVGRTE